jgi:hypothetical protein
MRGGASFGDFSAAGRVEPHSVAVAIITKPSSAERVFVFMFSISAENTKHKTRIQKADFSLYA